MKKKRIFYELGLRERICLAATMGSALILLIGYGYFGGPEHEHLSIGFMALLFLHLILSRRQQVSGRASEIVKNALVLAVSLCLVSGVLLSRYDLPFFPNIPHADRKRSFVKCLLVSGFGRRARRVTGVEFCNFSPEVASFAGANSCVCS